MNSKLTRKRIALIFAGATVVTAGSVGTAAALTGGDDDTEDTPIPASELERAEQAALDETGGGTVTSTELDDGGTQYEVEVVLDDGSEVEVELDKDLQVVGTDRETTDKKSDDD